MQPFQNALCVSAEFRGMILDKLDRSQHLAVARGLKEPHVLGIGFDDVQRFEIYALVAQSLAKLAGNQQIADDRGRARSK